MIPISDSPKARTFSIVNWLLIGINVLVFFYELGLSRTGLDQFFFDWGGVPSIFSDYVAHPSIGSWDEAVRPITAQFLHGGWLHIGGNMLFLWIFGNNVEDAMGHLRYLLFYLVAGFVAALAQIYADTNDLTPMVGASGAIAGVLGAYFVLYQRATVVALVPFLFFLPVRVPAILLILLWFATQVFNSISSVGYATGGEGGTAWWAHVGGFLFGAVLGRMLGTARRV